MRPSNTCFLTVMWQNSLGIWFIPCSTYNHLLSYPICWVLGSRISPKLRNQVLVGAAALCWAVWLCRNDVVFNGKIPNSYLHVIFRRTHWTREWAALSKEEEKIALIKCSQRLEGMALEFFHKAGWNFRRRIQL